MKSALIVCLVSLVIEQGGTQHGVLSKELGEPSLSSFQCFDAASLTESGTTTAQYRCYRKKAATSGFSHKLQEAEIRTTTTGNAKKSTRVNILGLKLEAEALFVICLVAANIVFFMCLAWCTKRRVHKVEMVLDEEKAMYYRYLHNYKTVVLHEVNELQDLNG